MNNKFKILCYSALALVILAIPASIHGAHKIHWNSEYSSKPKYYTIVDEEETGGVFMLLKRNQQYVVYGFFVLLGMIMGALLLLFFEKRNAFGDIIKKFKSLSIIAQGYFILGCLGNVLLLAIVGIPRDIYDIYALIYFGFLFNALFVAPFVIRKCIYVVTYTVVKSINDASKH